MKYIKTRFKVSSINYNHNITLSLPQSKTVPHQHTSQTTSRSQTQLSRCRLPTCFLKASNSQPYTAATDWLTQSNQHTRGATTLNSTRHLPHNIAVTPQQLYTEYCFAPHNELVEYTLNSLFNSHISRISSPLISSPILSYANHTMQCPLYTLLPVFPFSR